VLEIYVDGDACPVKAEVYRVAQRYGLKVTLVSNAYMRVPREPWLRLVVVDGQADAADDWITEHTAADDIVVSGDIPLAARCLAKGSKVLDLRGGDFTEDTIGEAMASRELLSHLRDLGTVTGGPPSLGPRDRSRFLHRLDETVQAIRRKQ
jgi:hypothetical protein